MTRALADLAPPPAPRDAAARALRVARVSVGFPPRRCGWSHHAMSLSEAQRHLGHAVTVFQPHAEPHRVPNVDVRHVEVPGLAEDPGRSLGRLVFGWRAARAIDRLARDSGAPDVVHAHGDIYEVFTLRAAARRAGARLIVTAHGGLSVAPRYRRVAPSLWRMVDGAIGVSADVVSQLAEHGVPADRLACISSGVDTGRFAPPDARDRAEARDALGIAPDDALCVAVGRLDAVKGFEHLVAAAARLRGTGGRAVRVAVVGEGPERDALARLVADGRLGDVVQLVGGASRDVVRRWFAAADLFALPSVTLAARREGTPTAVLEAMATGLPAIVTDSGGAAAVIEAIDGVTVVPQRDPAALAAAMRALADDAALAARVGARNRERALDRDWSRVAAAVCAFYDRVRALPPV